LHVTIKLNWYNSINPNILAVNTGCLDVGQSAYILTVIVICIPISNYSHSLVGYKKK